MSVLKVHYFLWFGSLSGIMPFVSIFAKEHSIANAEDVGLLYFVMPFIVSVIKPLFCSIADRNNSHRKVLLISVVATILGYGLLLTIIFIKISKISWYWFCFLILVANSSYGVVISLNDYLVMKEVTELNKSFGSYRVWGTIGWGGFGVIAGIVNEYIKELPYLLPGLLMFVIIEIVDLVIIFIKLKKLDIGSESNSVVDHNLTPKKRRPLSVIVKKPFISTHNSILHLIKIFRNNPSLIQYVIVVLMFGTLTAFHWSYYFWYLEIIRGKEQLLFGLALFIQSFLGELPIFLVADPILKFCGPAMSLNISLAAFAVRYFIYGYVFEVGNTYWDVLVVEVVQGLTFSLFYTTMANLAQHYAHQERNRSLAIANSSKTEDQIDGIEFENVGPSDGQQNSYATLQGIMSGAFEGIGLGMGALIGGFVIERVNVFYIWKVGAYLALGTILFNTTIEVIKHFLSKNSV